MVQLSTSLSYLKDSNFDSSSSGLKPWFFNLCYQLQLNMNISPFAYKILILIETFQLLDFAIHPKFPFLWSTPPMTLTRNSLQYFQLDTFLSTPHARTLALLISLLTLSTLLSLLTLAFSISHTSKNRPESKIINHFTISILAYLLLLIHTIFTSSFFQTFFVAIIC